MQLDSISKCTIAAHSNWSPVPPIHLLWALSGGPAGHWCPPSPLGGRFRSPPPVGLGEANRRSVGYGVGWLWVALACLSGWGQGSGLPGGGVPLVGWSELGAGAGTPAGRGRSRHGLAPALCALCSCLGACRGVTSQSVPNVEV